MNDFFYLNAIAQAIFDKKGSNILVLDLRTISSLTDYVVIAEGNVGKHVKAIGDAIVSQLEEMGQKPIFMEGRHAGDWVVIDYGNMMIHLFVPEMREKYQLERLWKEGKIVEVQINISNIK